MTIGTILSGSTLTLLTDNIQYMGLTFSGVIFGWLIVVWIFFEMGWDERAMLYKKYQYKYLRLPRTAKSVLALEQCVSGGFDRILYWGLAGTGIGLGLIYWKLTYPLALCLLSLATAMVISSCRFLQYAAVTQSELLIRYGTPPFRLCIIDLKNMTQADPNIKKNGIQLTLEDDNNTFSLNLPPESYVSRIVLSHLVEPR